MEVLTLPIDTESYSYRFYKTLNMDVKLKPNEYGEWDIVWDEYTNDWVNIDGFESLANACVIAIMTRWTEEEFLPPYEEFGCRVHELIKANKSKNSLYLIELYITETLENIRRVKKVNWVSVEDCKDDLAYEYHVGFSVSCMRDEDYDEEVDELDLDIIEEDFYI